MLVVEPPTARFEDGAPVAPHDEHLLERVSHLENKFSKLVDKLEQTFDLALRQTKHSYRDHALIEALISVLARSGTVNVVTLNKLWREGIRHAELEQATRVRREELRNRIGSGLRGAEQAALAKSIDDAIDMIEADEVLRGIRALQRVATHRSRDAALHALIGEYCFEIGKSTLARDHLDRALVLEPANHRVRLMLGLVCGDIGEIDRARENLNLVLKLRGESFAARYGLGRLSAAQQQWADALIEFKNATAVHASPEAHYALGCVYYQLGRDQMCLRHQRIALELDADYTAALFMLGTTLLRLGRTDQANAALTTVSCSDEPDYKSTARRILRSGEQPANLKPFGLNKGRRRGLLTSGDKRLIWAVLADVLAPDSIMAD
ncbi:MAG: hypothetical protein QOJ64_3660 [Acidobacteriota bacterium]|nr:hypothetical protein [Acidobacteriota bacterium]